MNAKAICTIAPGETNVAALTSALSCQVEKLPLERYCFRGGWPVNIEISSINIAREDLHELVGVLTISFTESGAACCSGDNFEYERFEQLSFTVDKQSGACRFPREG